MNQKSDTHLLYFLFAIASMILRYKHWSYQKFTWKYLLYFRQWKKNNRMGYL